MTLYARSRAPAFLTAYSKAADISYSGRADAGGAHHRLVRLDAEAADLAQVVDLRRRLDRAQIPDEGRSILDRGVREAFAEVLHELQFAREPPVPQVQRHGVLQRAELLGRVFAREFFRLERRVEDRPGPGQPGQRGRELVDGRDALDARDRGALRTRSRLIPSLRAAQSVMVKKSVLVFDRPSMMSAALGISTPAKYIMSLFWKNSPPVAGWRRGGRPRRPGSSPPGWRGERRIRPCRTAAARPRTRRAHARTRKMAVPVARMRVMPGLYR